MDESFKLRVDKHNLSEDENYVLQGGQADSRGAGASGPLHKYIDTVNDHSETYQLRLDLFQNLQWITDARDEADKL